MHVAKPAESGAVALVAWGNAWLTGHVGLDEAVDAAEKAAGPQVVTGARSSAQETSIRRALADLRVAGLTALRLALPVPGDPLGLTGPPDLNAEAIEAGAAVILDLADGSQQALIPAEDRRGSSYAGIRWTPRQARPGSPDVPALADADHQLTLAVRDVTEALLTVDDISRPDPEIMNALAGLRDTTRDDQTLAPGYPPRAHRVAALAGRLAVVVDLARALDGRALTADQTRRRADALNVLDRAVRRARVAAHNSAFDPRPA
jgi:hypothetical protein